MAPWSLLSLKVSTFRPQLPGSRRDKVRKVIPRILSTSPKHEACFSVREASRVPQEFFEQILHDIPIAMSKKPETDHMGVRACGRAPGSSGKNALDGKHCHNGRFRGNPFRCGLKGTPQTNPPFFLGPLFRRMLKYHELLHSNTGCFAARTY